MNGKQKEKKTGKNIEYDSSNWTRDQNRQFRWNGEFDLLPIYHSRDPRMIKRIWKIKSRWHPQKNPTYFFGFPNFFWWFVSRDGTIQGISSFISLGNVPTFCLVFTIVADSNGLSFGPQLFLTVISLLVDKTLSGTLASVSCVCNGLQRFLGGNFCCFGCFA